MNDSNRNSKLLAASKLLRQDFETAVMRAIEAHPEWPYWLVGNTPA